MSREAAIVTKTGPYRQFWATPPAPASYAAINPTLTPPFGANQDGVLSLDNNGMGPGSFAKFAFWALATAGATYSCKIVGYQQIGGGKEWLPITLADITCTVSSTTRPSNTSERWVSGIVVNSALVVASYEIIPADSNIPVQYLKLDLMGVQGVKLVPGAQASGTVTSMNGALCDF